MPGGPNSFLVFALPSPGNEIRSTAHFRLVCGEATKEPQGARHVEEQEYPSTAEFRLA